MRLMRLWILLLLGSAAGAAIVVHGREERAPGDAAAGIRIEVSYPASVHAGPITGRVLVMVSRSATPEPRLAVAPGGPAIAGVDIDGVLPGDVVFVDGGMLGYPHSLGSLPAGDYFVQALLNVYTRFKRADGHTIWVRENDTMMPLTRAPGNLYSAVQKVTIGGGAAGDNAAASPQTIRLELSHIIPDLEKPTDTEWVKHVRVRSERLSAFWGRPVHLDATVLLPKGYDAHPDTHYPVAYVHGHGVPFSFSTTPDTAERAAAMRASGSNLKTGYEFAQEWMSEKFPRLIAITFQQPTPYFPDSYSVNSANNGPYGDAFMQELLPYLETRFRIIRQPYARLVEGASTGGWEALALQLYHPDTFGGAWIFNPDPIDFRRYQHVNIYEDANAFQAAGASEARPLERPFRRSVEGQVIDTVRGVSLFEQVLGTRGRSGYQFHAWEAVFAPVGPDGYPRPLWDKVTGVIDREVANAMREGGYDLRAYAERHWPVLGPKLVDKLHFYTGDMDNFYLNLAVYHFEQFLSATTSPHYRGHFEYGRPMAGHNWHATDWAGLVRLMAGHVKAHAPAGQSSASWNY
jgi:Putative esterase